MATKTKKKTRLDSLYTYLHKGTATDKQKAAYTAELITTIGYVVMDVWCDLENKVKEVAPEWAGETAEKALQAALTLAGEGKRFLDIPFFVDLQQTAWEIYTRWKPLKLDGISNAQEKELRIKGSRLFRWYNFLIDMPYSVSIDNGIRSAGHTDAVHMVYKSGVRRVIESQLAKYIDALQPYQKYWKKVQAEIKKWEAGKGKLRRKDGFERPPINPSLSYIFQSTDLQVIQDIRRTDWAESGEKTATGKLIPGLKVDTKNFVIETERKAVGEAGNRLLAYLLGELTARPARYVMVELENWKNKTECNSLEAASRQIRRGYDELRNVKHLNGNFYDITIKRRAKREMVIVGTIDTIEEYGYRIFIDNAFLEWVQNFPPMPYALEDHLRNPKISSFLYYLYSQRHIREKSAKEPVMEMVLSVPTLIAHCPNIPREADWDATIRKNLYRNITGRLFSNLDAFSNRFSYQLCDARKKPLTDGAGRRVETPEDVEKVKRNYGVLQSKYVVFTFNSVYSDMQ